MWKQISRVAAAILTVSALLFLPLNAYRFTGSVWLATALGFAVAIILLVALAHYFFPGAGHFKSGYTRFNAKSLILDRDSKITVDQSYVATIQKRTLMVFLEQPDPDDLVDMIDTLPGDRIDERSYSSPDSSVADVRSKNPHNLLVYWRPLQSIKEFVPYTHDSTHCSPSLYGPDYLYHSIYFDRRTGTAKLTLSSEHALDEVFAFKLPWWASQITERRIYDFALKSKRRRRCAQPTIDSNRKIVRWVLDRPELGRTYVLFALFPEEKDKLIHRMRSRTLSARLARLLRR